MADKNTDVTIAIPVRNEERNLAVCLQAICSDFARQVVMIDSASTDATADAARAHGAELVNFQWDGHFPRRFLLRGLEKVNGEWHLGSAHHGACGSRTAP